MKMKRIFSPNFLLVGLLMSIGVSFSCGQSSPPLSAECSTLNPPYSSVNFTGPPMISLSALAKGEPIVIYSKCSFNTERELVYARLVQILSTSPFQSVAIPLFRDEQTNPVADTFRFRSKDDLSRFKTEIEGRLQVGYWIDYPNGFSTESLIVVKLVP